jgi:MFS family permease
MNFRREEIARRISDIYLCSGISGAVGGLIATGLIRIESGNMVGWQYLYVVEGVISLAAAPLVWFTVPNHLKDAWFLNAEEKQGAIVRATVLGTENQHNDEFSWREIRSGFLDWKVSKDDSWPKMHLQQKG